MAESPMDRFVRRQRWLEPVANALQAVVSGAYRVLGRPGQGLKNLMHGTRPLGHPLHPALSDVPIGAWTAMVVADYVAHFFPRLPTEAGDIALIVGLLVALPTALSGLTDYSETYAHERRVATLHGLTMVSVVALMAASLGLRWWGGFGLHPLALGLSTAGYALVLIGGYLGGHLVFGIGTMVNRNAFTEGPAEQYVQVGAAADFAEGVLKRVDAGGMPTLVVRVRGQLHAIGAVCSHAGGPLDEGTLDGLTVTCPWHGSRFCVANARVERGPATFDQPLFDVREENGNVLLKLVSPLH